MLKRLLAAVILIPIVLAVGFVFSASALAKAAVAEGGTRALGVKTTLEDAEIGLFAGHVRLDSLAVRNPEGFEPEYMLELGKGVFDVSLPSLLKPRIIAPLLELEDVVLTLSNKGTKTNFGAILDNMASDAGSAPDEETEGSSQKTFVIDRIVIRNVKVIAAVGLAGASTNAAVDIPEVILDDLASREFTMRELITYVMRALIEEAMENGGGFAPEAMLAGIKERFSGIGTTTVEANVDKAKEELKALGGELEEAGKGLKGIFDRD